jgi:hypothetical protein
MRNLVACMLLLGSALPAADLGGTWMMEQAGRGGSQTRKTYYYFKVEGNSFTGQMVSSTDSRKVQNGKIDGDTITFETLGAFNDRPNQMRAVFNGEELTISGVGGRGGRGGPAAAGAAAGRGPRTGRYTWRRERTWCGRGGRRGGTRPGRRTRQLHASGL